MDVLRIVGGQPLAGSVQVSGAKNAALPIMAASLLTSGTVRLNNVPRLTDVHTMGQLLTQLGMAVRYDESNRLALETVDSRAVVAQHQFVERMRASFCVLGPLLARRGRARLPLPGGCRLGSRPIDLHLKGLAALGADIRIQRGLVVASAKRLRGRSVSMLGLRGPTVTGTANVLCAAVLARGQTIIRGAAQEPEVVDLGRCLQMQGARIEGLGTTTIEVRGVDELGSTDYEIIPDRIEAGTLLLAGLVTSGAVAVVGVRPDHMTSVLDALETMGAQLDVGPERISLLAPLRPRPLRFSARPYPGVPTDLQAQLTAALTLADGPSQVSDAVFPERLMHVAELQRLGASISRRGRHVAIASSQLRGCTVAASDLRGSAALVLAGLAASGETRVERLEHLDRGYEAFSAKLAQLGAQVERFPHILQANRAAAFSTDLPTARPKIGPPSPVA